MQRVRMSLPYFADNGWNAEIVMVHEIYSDLLQDELLVKNIPKHIVIHKIEAFSKKITSKFGLGSLALRSLYFYIKYVDKLLKAKSFDLIYFSTTEFAITILGNYWKKKFNIPYVIDMQDPWHSNYYEDKPKTERPKKYWFSYRLNKYLEPIAMRKVGGLISVSKGYIDDLVSRYPRLNSIPFKIITFAAFKPDLDFVKSNKKNFKLPFKKNQNLTDIVYVGRGGYDMQKAANLLFSAFSKGLEIDPINFNKLRFHFIGTSYAPSGKGLATIKPLADEIGIGKYVHEKTDRIPYYDGINCLIKADALIILGSDDSKYTASKIYPYILADKPLLAILHPDSSAYKIIEQCNAGKSVSFLSKNAVNDIYFELSNFVTQEKKQATDWVKFKTYDASNMVKLQCELFNKSII